MLTSVSTDAAISTPPSSLAPSDTRERVDCAGEAGAETPQPPSHDLTAVTAPPTALDVTPYASSAPRTAEKTRGIVVSCVVRTPLGIQSRSWRYARGSVAGRGGDHGETRKTDGGGARPVRKIDEWAERRRRATLVLDAS